MRRPPIAAAALAALALACSADPPSGVDLVRNADTGSAGDTTSAVPTDVRVTGRVLGVSARAPVAGSADTLQFAPVPGAAITVKRNILVNGQSAQEVAARLTADRDGRFELGGLHGGYYIVEASAPWSGYRDGWEYLPATHSLVEVNVFLWKE